MSTRRKSAVTVWWQIHHVKEGDWLVRSMAPTGEVFGGKANTLDADPSSAC